MLDRIYLRNFRNYQSAEVFFHPGVNQIIGANAQGKTNLLEAIFLVSTGRSFRTLRLSEAIRHGESFFYLEADFTKDGMEQSVKLSFDGKTKRLQYNSTEYAHFSPLLGLLPTVLLLPEDAALVSGSPPERRRFLDLHIAQSDPLYVYHIARYYKAMKHRNHLLRQKSQDAIASFEEIMKGAACYIQQKRKDLLEALTHPAQDAMRSLSSCQESLAFSFEPSVIEQFETTRPKEMVLGTTLLGPHRDDFSLLICGKDAKLFASQGQKRCIAAALRIAQKAHFQRIYESPPIFSADDFGAHLDPERNSQLLQMVSGTGQVLLTAPLAVSKEETTPIVVKNGSLHSNRA